jgi:type IV pilus assembly protein PilB
MGGAVESEVDQYECMRGAGCAHCSGSGIKGRVAIYEVMTMNDVLREAILAGAGPVQIKKAALKGGMRSLRQAGLMKVKKGEVAFDQLLAMTVSDDEANR